MMQFDADRRFDLPPVIRHLVQARNALRENYAATGLTFTLDGNLLGDLGEALAVELFGLRLATRTATGIDGTAPDGRTVQVKVSASGRGGAFRMVDNRAQHLLFFSLDIETATGVVDYNGPEEVVVRRLPTTWTGQRSLTLRQMRAADLEVKEEDRLARLVTRGV